MIGLEINNKRMLKNPVLTVGVINFNQGHYIHKCLDRIRNQTFSDFELFIIDDLSTDNSVDLIQHYIDDHQLDCVFIKNKINQGICRNLNQLLQQAKGKYFTFIAADDWGDLNRFEEMVAALESSDAEVATVYSDAVLVDEKENLIAPSYLHYFRPDLASPPSGNIFKQLLSFNFIPAMATVSKTEYIKEVGGFDENLKFEDFDLWLKISHRYKIIFSGNSKCYYRILGNSLIRSLGARKWEDLINVYSKYLGENKDIDVIVGHMINICLQNVYFNDSPNFDPLVRKYSRLIPINWQLKLFQALKKLGLKGRQFKRISNNIMRRKS